MGREGTSMIAAATYVHIWKNWLCLVWIRNYDIIWWYEIKFDWTMVYYFNGLLLAGQHARAARTAYCLCAFEAQAPSSALYHA